MQKFKEILIILSFTLLVSFSAPRIRLFFVQ